MCWAAQRVGTVQPKEMKGSCLGIANVLENAAVEIYLGFDICELSRLFCSLAEKAGSYLQHGSCVVLDGILL